MLKNEVIRRQDRLRYHRYGKQHRINGPFIIWSSGDYCWYQYSVPHRKDGPSVILNNGDIEYWIRGKYVEE